MIRNALDNGKFACGVFIDLRKAFDTVNHDILLSKLNHHLSDDTNLLYASSSLKDIKQKNKL